MLASCLERNDLPRLGRERRLALRGVELCDPARRSRADVDEPPASPQLVDDRVHGLGEGVSRPEHSVRNGLVEAVHEHDKLARGAEVVVE